MHRVPLGLCSPKVPAKSMFLGPSLATSPDAHAHASVGVVEAKDGGGRDLVRTRFDCAGVLDPVARLGS